MAERTIVIADGHHRYETALAYRDELRAREGDSPADLPCDFVLMHLVNMHGEGLVVYPTHRVVPGQARRHARPPVGASPSASCRRRRSTSRRELNAVPLDTIAFAVWHGAERPALLCTLRDRAAISHGDARRAGAPCARSTPPCSRRRSSSRCSACSTPSSSRRATPSSTCASSALRRRRSSAARPAAAFILRAPTLEQVRARRRRRRRDAAEVDVLLPEALERVPPEPAGGLIDQRWLGFCRQVVRRRRRGPRRAPHPRPARAGRRPGGGRRRHDRRSTATPRPPSSRGSRSCTPAASTSGWSPRSWASGSSAARAPGWSSSTRSTAR